MQFIHLFKIFLQITKIILFNILYLNKTILLHGNFIKTNNYNRFFSQVLLKIKNHAIPQKMLITIVIKIKILKSRFIK